MSAEKDNEYFSDGLSEEILDKLARNPALRVMARTSSFSYKGKNVPIQQIGRELNVGTIIEGSVRRAGNQLRITAQLINAADGTHIWSETYDKELTTAGIFAIQDEIAQKIAARLAPNSAPTQSTAAALPTKNLAAYEAYLRGREQMKGVGRFKDAVGFFERATELDSGFALAWVQLARVHAFLYYVGGDVDEEREMALAHAAIDQAQHLQPNLPEIHLALATVRGRVDRDFPAATRELDLLARSQPEDSETYQLRGTIDQKLGRFSASVAVLRQALELDPKNGFTLNSLGLSLEYAGRYSEAASAFEQAAQIDPLGPSLANRAEVFLRWKADLKLVVDAVQDIPFARTTSTSVRQVIEYYWASGNYAKAFELIERAGWSGALSQHEYLFSNLFAARVREAMGDSEGARRDYLAALPQIEHTRDTHAKSSRVYLPLAQVYAGLGRKDEALAAVQRSLELLPANQDQFIAAQSSLRVLVDVEGRFGMIDEALEVVKQQIAAGWWKRNVLLLHPDFIHLQKEPRFRALAEKAPL
jgi:TolB-like protein/Tfp pilus assembly protein PilF